MIAEEKNKINEYRKNWHYQLHEEKKIKLENTQEIDIMQ